MNKDLLKKISNEFQTNTIFVKTAQSRLAEVEGNLKETVTERDELKHQLDTIASAGNQTNSRDSIQKIKSLEQKVRDQNEQSERMQDQLIEYAEENKVKVKNFLGGLHVENQRVEVLDQESKKSIFNGRKALPLEKDTGI